MYLLFSYSKCNKLKTNFNTKSGKRSKAKRKEGNSKKHKREEDDGV